MLVTVHPENPQVRHIRRVAEILDAGGLIIYPTDTYYGLGCDINNKRAIEKIYKIKKMSKNKPLSFVCSDLKHLSRYAVVSNYAYRTMKHLLPGPYTFVLEATPLVPKIMLTKRRRVGIRVPDNRICLDIVCALERPIISTSVRLDGDEILVDPEEIYMRFKGLVDIVIDGGAVAAEPSSVVDLSGSEPVVLRRGIGDVEQFV